MSPASQWFSKRIYSSTSKPPTSDDCDRSLSADRLPLHSSDGFKFSGFASVINRKSKLKKPRPILSIPHCPVPPLVSRSAVQQSGPPSYSNRPPSMSISSTVRSRNDSPELMTPSDVYRDRGSLPLSVLTLSDDPFAAEAISVPRSILDRGRVSVCSSTSANNLSSNEDEVDLWQPPLSASTFSQYHGGRNGLSLSESTWSPVSPKADGYSPWSRETARESEIVDGIFQGSPVGCSYMDKISQATLSKNGSLSTLTGQGSPDSFPVAVRPTFSTRRNTEAGSLRSSTVSQPSKGSTSPSAETSFRSRTLSYRQYPAMPCVSPELVDGSAEYELSSSLAHTGSSPSISFSPNRIIQDLNEEEIINPRYRPYKEKETNLGSDFGTLRQSVTESGRVHVLESFPGPPAHQLKKSMSYSTLQRTKRGSTHSNAFHDHCRRHEELKRQSSFRQSRCDASNSTSASTATLLDPESSNECRKPSLPHPQTVVRKRLFSGSNKRPSTATADEDVRSVFSLPTDAESYPVSTRAVASLLDEPSSEPITPGMVYPAVEFTPQHIMSTAEMLKVEAIVQDEFDAKYGEAIRNRQRGLSSPSIPMYGGTRYTKEGINTAPTYLPRLASIHNAPDVSNKPTSMLSPRPSSAQTAFSSASMPPSLSTTSPRLGLPHPPRPRTRPHTAETSYDDPFNRRMSTVPFTPLSPPPSRLKRPNPVSSIISEKVAPQRFVIRKPSFLEIADETSGYEESFLEFDSGKESLDC